METINLKEILFTTLVVLSSSILTAQTSVDKSSDINAATLPTSYKWDVAQPLPAGWKSYGMKSYTTGHDAANAGKFDTQNDSLVIHFNDAVISLSFYLKAYSLKAPYSFKVLESTDGITYTELQCFSDSTKTIATKYTNCTLYPTANARYIKFEYTKRTGGNIAIDDIQIQGNFLSAGIDDVEEEVSKEVKVYIYPNPVHNILYIQSYNEAFGVKVYDLLGNQISKRNLGVNDSAEINTSNLKAGLYLVSIYNEDKEFKTIKFIKR